MLTRSTDKIQAGTFADILATRYDKARRTERAADEEYELSGMNGFANKGAEVQRDTARAVQNEIALIATEAGIMSLLFKASEFDNVQYRR